MIYNIYMSNDDLKTISLKISDIMTDENLVMHEQLFILLDHLYCICDAADGLVEKESLFPMEVSPDQSISNAIDNLKNAMRILKREGL